MGNNVSVIVPFYNSHTTIVETLDSVYNQTYKNIEVILVDDGSKEDVLPTINKYIQNNNLIFLKQENKGVSYARNTGASIAKGDYLLFLDADDLIDKNYIKKCVDAFKENKNLKIVYSKARIFGRENKSWELPEYTTFKDFLVSNCIYISALLKRKDFEAVNGFDTELDFYEDWDLWINILKNNGEIYQIPEELFFYRKNKDLSSASDNANISRHAKNRFKLYSKHYDLYEKEYTNFEEIFLKYIIAERRKRRRKKKWYKVLYYKLFK